MADLVVDIIPAMRKFSSGCQMLGALRKVCIIGQYRAAAASGDGLVAVKAQGS